MLFCAKQLQASLTRPVTHKKKNTCITPPLSAENPEVTVFSHLTFTYNLCNIFLIPVNMNHFLACRSGKQSRGAAYQHYWSCPRPEVIGQADRQRHMWKHAVVNLEGCTRTSTTLCLYRKHNTELHYSFVKHWFTFFSHLLQWILIYQTCCLILVNRVLVIEEI